MNHIGQNRKAMICEIPCMRMNWQKYWNKWRTCERIAYGTTGRDMAFLFIGCSHE